MAAQSHETLSERVVVLMTPSQKRGLADRARTAGMPLAEYMRLAAEEFEPISVEQRAELEAMIDQLRDLNKRNQEAMERTEMMLATPIDEDALRARYRAQFEAMDVDWAGVADRLGLSRRLA